MNFLNYESKFKKKNLGRGAGEEGAGGEGGG